MSHAVNTTVQIICLISQPDGVLRGMVCVLWLVDFTKEPICLQNYLYVLAFVTMTPGLPTKICGAVRESVIDRRPAE